MEWNPLLYTYSFSMSVFVFGLEALATAWGEKTGVLYRRMLALQRHGTTYTNEIQDINEHTVYFVHAPAPAPAP